MEMTDILFSYDTVVQNSGYASVVVVAAGSSTRMGGISKQMMTIGGIPVLARTLLAFERAKCVKNIVVVARECDILAFQTLVRKYMISKVTNIVEGGSCREESVRNGLARLDDSAQYVLVHDGARPLVSDAVIHTVTDALKLYDAVACGVPVKDTLKVVQDGMVTDTLDRSSIYSVQTPQGFRTSVLKDCFQKADDLSRFTDDCSVAEAFGYKVHMVYGDYNNIKITTKEDIIIAESILGQGGER